MADSIAFKYRAFISYSHAETNWAKWLHRALESFRLDKDLVGRETATGTIPEALRPIFRDRDDFTAGHTLTEQTLAALDASHALIVICSPASAKSHYVNEEIRLFKLRHPNRPVVPLIVAGKPGDAELECFPPALKFKIDSEGRVTKTPIELLAADAREEGDGKSLALAKAIAGLLGVSSDDIFRRAVRERRRKGRVRNGIIAVLAILAVAATGSAVYAWQQLKTNEAFLNATLKRATEIVSTSVAQAESYGVPRKATLALLAQAEGLFDDMARLGRETPELRYRRAMMLIEFARNYAILGDTKTWHGRAEEAARLLTALAYEMPGDGKYEFALASALDVLGDGLIAQGNLSAASKYYQYSFNIMDRLAKAEPNNALRQHALSVAYSKLGDVLHQQGYPENLPLALEFYRDSVAIEDRLARADPSNTELQRDLAVTYCRVGGVLRDQGNLSEALTSFRDCLAIGQRLAKADPNNAGWQSDLAFSYSNIGRVLMEQGGLTEALESEQDSLAIRARLAKADPSNSEWQQNLSVGCDDLGDVLLGQGNLTAALKSYQDSLAIRARLAKADPLNAGWQRDLAINHRKVALVLDRLGEKARALGELQQGRAIIARLKQQSPDNLRLPNDLAWFDAEISKLEQADAFRPGIVRRVQSPTGQ